MSALPSASPAYGDEFVVFGAPSISDLEIAEVIATLRSGWLGTGPRTAEFEREFARYIGTRYAVGTNSGTAALHLALNCLGIGPGDEVITTPLTFVATANVIEHCGAVPVFADVSKHDGNINPAEVARRVSARTKAVIPVHYAGALADVRAIRAAVPSEVAIVVDAAHAVEARNGRTSSAGGGATMTAYSFYVTKNLTTGEGGMLATDDHRLSAVVHARRLHGLDNDAWTRYGDTEYREYDMDYPGFKYNMTDLQASLGLHQLRRLHLMQARRRQIWEIYNDAFANLRGVEIPPISLRCLEGLAHALHLYTLWFDWDDLRTDRASLIAELRRRGIGTGWHFRPVHLYRFYREKYGLEMGAFPVAEEIGRRTVSLPLSAALSDAHVRRVVGGVKAAVATVA